MKNNACCQCNNASFVVSLVPLYYFAMFAIHSSRCSHRVLFGVLGRNGHSQTFECCNSLKSRAIHTVVSQMESTAHDTLCIRESTLNDLSSLTCWVKTITLSHTCRHRTLDALYLAIEDMGQHHFLTSTFSYSCTTSY